jgi:hypothetical protein
MPQAIDKSFQTFIRGFLSLGELGASLSELGKLLVRALLNLDQLAQSSFVFAVEQRALPDELLNAFHTPIESIHAGRIHQLGVWGL